MVYRLKITQETRKQVSEILPDGYAGVDEWIGSILPEDMTLEDFFVPEQGGETGGVPEL